MPVALPLIDLSVLAVAWACIEICLVLAAIITAIAEILSSFPIIGKIIAWPFKELGQAISHGLGELEAGVDAAIGASWHQLARYADDLWHIIEESAQGYLLLAREVAHLVYDHTGLRAAVHLAERVLHGIEHGVRDLTRRYHGIEHRVRSIEHEIAQGIGNDVRTGLHDLTKVVHGVEHTVTDTIPREIGYVDGRVSALERFIGAIPGVDYLTWAAGIVTAALGVLGLRNLTCPSFLRALGRSNCGLGNLLEDLLGLLADVFLFETFCEYLPYIEDAVGAVEGPLVELISSAANGACSKPPAGYGPLPVPQLYLPANPGFTLALP